jgi:hypothetical protein
MNNNINSTTGYQNYLERLQSSNPELVIEAAHALGDLGDERAVPILIELLQTTTDPDIRDAAAVGLRELGDQSALHPLVSLINDPKTEGNRGTLVYALEGLDCASVIPLLVDLVINSNFEVSHQAFTVIDSIDSEVDEGILNLCIQKVQDALSENEEKADLLEDLVDLLSDLKS